MDTPTLPDGLDDSERALFELARERIPLAEVAVRMGVPIGDAARRIDALAARLHVDGREGLQRWAPPASQPSGKDGAGLASATADAGIPGRFSRRSLLVASASVGVLAIGGLSAAALTRGWGTGSGSGSKPLPSTSPSRSVVTATATPAPLASFAFISAAFEHRTFSKDEAIDWPQGAFFLSTLNGSVDGWRLTDTVTADPNNVFFKISDDNSTALANAGGVPYLLCRYLSRAFTWKPGLLGLAAASERRLVFQRGNGPADDPNPGYKGEFFVTDLNGSEVSRFEFPAGGQPMAPMLFSPDGKTLVAAGGNTSWADYKLLFMVDIESGTVRQIGTLPDPPEGFNASGPQFTNLSGSNAWTVAVNYSPAYNPSDPSAGPTYHGFARIYGWDGTLQSETATFYGADISPDGRFVASTTWMRFVIGQSDGDSGEQWPAVVVSDTATGEPLFRVKSATLDYGDGLLGSRWYPDSSGFIIQTGPMAAPQNGSRATRPQYAAVSVESRTVNPLPFSAGKRWSGPVPSQTLPDMYALGHTAVSTEGSSRRTFAANVPGTFSQHIAPWGNRSDEIRFALPEFGHGLGPPPTLLAPAIEQAPFSDSLALAVSGTGDCLNIRPEPSLGSTPLVCVPDGTQLEVTAPDTPLTPGGTIVASVTNDDGSWIHVVVVPEFQAPSGIEGWASADYLRWH